MTDMLLRSACCWSALALILTAGPRLAHAEGDAKPAAQTTAHQKGGRPREPADRLPSDVPLPLPDDRARHAIADGPTEEEIRRGPADDQLLSLREAEKALFSEPLPGVSSGWSFRLPEEAIDEDTHLGLPFSSPHVTEQPPLSDEDVAWIKTLTLPDLPIVLDRRVVTYLKFYRDSDQGRTIAAIWTRKSGRYIAEMKAQFRRAGLPTDLVWLSMIESGHNPTIKSPAGAVGLWQFMPESGRMYGLVVDRWVDERRDPARSTQAAIRFLSDLYRRFGNWELAMGAYNMGYAGMSRAVAKFSTNDYWALSRMESGMPWETTLYVPKIFALAIVMNNRAAFGVGKTTMDSPVSFDTILLEPATPLQDVAAAAQVALSDLRALNPQFLTDRLPPEAPTAGKKWAVHVPRGTGKTAMSRLKPQRTTYQLYTTRLGDTPELIAADHLIGTSELSTLNDLDLGQRLEPKTVLLLPENAQARSNPEPSEIVVGRPAQPGPDQTRVFYRVVHGDSLSQVASALGVQEMDLCRWNLLNPKAFLREGMTLQVLLDSQSPVDDVRVVPESAAHVLVAGSPEFHDHFEGLKGKQRVTITVREGDTLSGIGARYGMTVGSMERVNRRSRRQTLLPGEQLIVYTERRLSADKTPSQVAPLPPLPGVAE